jgi:hypothetical protein
LDGQTCLIHCTENILTKISLDISGLNKIMGDKWAIQVSIIAAFFDERTDEMGINFF